MRTTMARSIAQTPVEDEAPRIVPEGEEPATEA
jgi:hypothetical protein